MLKYIMLFFVLLIPSICFAQVKREIYFFSANWCPACQQFKNRIWSDQEVKDLLSQYNRTVEVDIDKYKEISQKWKVRSIPTVVIADLLEDGKAKEIYRWQPSSNWIRNKIDFKNVLKKYSPAQNSLDNIGNRATMGGRNAKILHNGRIKSLLD